MPRLRILFFVLAANFDRLFASFLEELLEHGHQVHVVVEKQRRAAARRGRVLEALALRYPWFTHGHDSHATTNGWRTYGVPPRPRLPALSRARVPGRRRAASAGARAGPAAWSEATTLSPPRRRVVSYPLSAGSRTGSDRRAHGAAGRGRAGRRARVAARRAGFEAERLDRIAAELGVPTVLPVASWDNLTNKGVLKNIPTLTSSGTRPRRTKPSASTACPESGSAWAGRTPTTTGSTGSPTVREMLLAELASRPGRTSSTRDRRVHRRRRNGFRAGVDRALRRSPRPAVRELGVLIRPHPQNARAGQLLAVGRAGRDLAARGGLPDRRG